jgi:hypothetical protein
MTIGTRTFLELRVGRTHAVDVLVHVRRADVKWFHSSPEHKKELFRLLSQHVIFREFEKEIQEYHNLRNGVRPTVEVGEKNKRGKKGKKRKGAPAPESPNTEKPKRAVRHVSGTGMQITYKTEGLNDKQGATLIFPMKNGSTDEEKSSKGSPPKFRSLPKLSKRIVLWCYPKDQKGEDSPIKGQGFPRPEMVPITSLFREPATAAGND